MMADPKDKPRGGYDLATAILEACAALIVVLDRDGRIVRFNRACERLTGFSSQEVVGRAVWDILLQPDEIAAVKGVFADFRAGRFPNEHENYWLTKDGGRRLISWANTAVMDGAGKVEYVISTGLDVTEQRKTEKELASFRFGIERSGEIIFLTDRDGHILYVNPAFEQVYGYSKEEAVGRTPRILKSGLHPRETYTEFWERLLAKETVSVEIINKTKDGRLLTVAGSANPVLDESGDIIGFLAIQRDITDRKKTERALQASEERLRMLMEKVPDGVGVVAPDGRILYTNPAVCAMLGYTAKELAGRQVAELQHPDDRDRAAGRMKALFGGDPEHPSEYRLLHKDGSIITTEVTSRVVDYDGQPAILSTMRDLTERLELEQQLRQAQKMEAVGQLAGGIAHDFNNLLTVVQVNTELVAAKLTDPDTEITADLKELQAAVVRGKNLIEQLIAFSRREELKIEPLDLRTLIADFEPTLRRLLPEHIEIRIDLPDRLPKVVASTGSAEQIVMNLATNARDAMPEGGQLRIGVWPTRLESGDWLAAERTVPGEFVCLAVSDTGVGMEELTQARMFEPFFTTRRSAGGTGLGMAVVYGLVKQLGGHVHVYSEVDQGTTIKVYFPVAAADVPEEADGPIAAKEVCGGSETVLVAEDEPALRRAAKRSLERLGYRVLLAADGEEALKVFDAEGGRVDLIVTDIIMPKRGGRALYKALRDRGATVPFLFASGYTAEDVEESGHLDSGLPFLAKPWTLSELARKVREVLDANNIQIENVGA